MKLYLRTLSVLYLIGASLHVLDLFDLRLHFSEMNFIWKVWILYLCVFDLFASFGLWRQTQWGKALFIFIATSQIVAYVGFQHFFGQQYILIAFHILTLAIFGLVVFTQTQEGDLLSITKNREEKIL